MWPFSSNKETAKTEHLGNKDIEPIGEYRAGFAYGIVSDIRKKIGNNIGVEGDVFRESENGMLHIYRLPTEQNFYDRDTMHWRMDR